MANSTTTEMQVSQGAVTGALFYAPPTATVTLPTDATTVLDTDLANVGYIGSDGITPTREVSTEDVKDMNGASLRTVQTDFSKSLQAQCYQTTNAALNQAIFGTANVTVTAANGSHGRIIAIQDKGRVADRGTAVVETYDGTAKERRVYPVAQITSVEEGPLVGSAVKTYTVTFSIYPDASGVYEYRYNDDGLISA